MAVIIEIYIVCDNCGNTCNIDIGKNTTVAIQRNIAKENAWRFFKGKDYCPSCITKKADLQKFLKK